MGKRKERRLAALGNSGRRVKLDLFAEPSGDLGGSTVHDEVGGDIDRRQRAGSPNSPTSSGQQPQNPLLLLGQYSDDELGEDSDRELEHDTGENPLLGRNDKVMGSLVEGDEDADDKGTAKMDKQEEMERDSTSLHRSENLKDIDKRENDATASGDLSKNMDLAEQTSVLGLSDVQVVGDVSSGWKMVMHKETNSYYYWNMETGETSWEVPDVLAGESDLTSNNKTLVTEESESAIVNRQESNITSGVNLDGFSAADTTEGSVDVHNVPYSTQIFRDGSQVNGQNEGYENDYPEDAKEGTGVNESGLANSSSAFNVSMDNPSKISSETFIHDSTATGEHISYFDLSSRLVTQGEWLLERLKSLKGSNYLQGRDWTSKYILEVEIRLSDFKSLLSHGSSLHAFWEHSDRKLKHLENCINEDIYRAAVAAQLDGGTASDVLNCRGNAKLQETISRESAEDGVGNGVSFSPENSHIPTNTDSMAVRQCDTNNDTSVINENISSSEAVKQLGNDDIVSEQINGARNIEESAPEHSFHSGDDVDMDVDMEVECASSAGNTAIMDASTAKNFTHTEQSIQPNLPTNYSSFVSEDGSIAPPPPEEEWIPPPPPDNEEVPPPPPDEPPEPSYLLPPSYTQTAPLSYTEQYNLPYPVSSFEYCGQSVTEVPSSNYYGHSETCQVALPHATIYYDAIPNTYAVTAPVVVNAIEPVAYRDGAVPPLPLVSTEKSPLLLAESTSVSYGNHTFDQIGPVDSFVGAVYGSMPNVSFDVYDVKNGNQTDKKAYVDSTPALTYATATDLVEEKNTVPSSDTVAAAAAVATTSAASKIHSKALRGKKRTVAVAPSLRSNKKVSSLVDKWKAAKEEMLEDEEEPENAYELLERKRQREIEEWHAQQIASGGAKDNANFQPLGGDWRERVKRRRARLASKAAEIPTEEASDGSQRPDLTELSKDLPSGWQAYWDASSKKVYYGNVITSETTWTKPTK